MNLETLCDLGMDESITISKRIVGGRPHIHIRASLVLRDRPPAIVDRLIGPEFARLSRVDPLNRTIDEALTTLREAIADES